MPPRRVRKLSWVGYEEQKQELARLARAYRDVDLNLANLVGSSNAISLTIRARKDPRSVELQEASDAGTILGRLMDLHANLVIEHGLDFHLVRKEWATILDPSPRERELCEQNILA